MKHRHLLKSYVLVVLYLFILCSFLLAPFDFHFPFLSNDLRWLSETNGLQIKSTAGIRSPSSADKLYDAMVSGDGITIEVRAAPEDIDQKGPARIVSYSRDKFLRNFTLGQDHNALVMRLRTTKTDLNGKSPELRLDDVFHSDDPQHIVVTYDFSEERVYVDGQIQLRAHVPGGKFSNWDQSYSLILGNEATGNRTWLGKLFLIAIYNRALSEGEIWKNYMVGRVFDSAKIPSNDRIKDGLVVLYLFNEGKGRWILDRSGKLPPVDLKMLSGPQITNQAFLAGLNEKFDLKDMILNIMLFIPLGFLFHAAMRSRYGSSLKIAGFVFILGALFTLIIESLQYFSLTRFSSMADLLSNMIGTALGISIDRSREYFVKAIIRPGNRDSGVIASDSEAIQRVNRRMATHPSDVRHD